MSVVMSMKWDGVTPDQYDALLRVVNWEGEAPIGGMYHAAWFENNALNVVDVWESAELFQTFADQRLMPGVAKLGIEGQPAVQMHETHRVYAPGYLEKAMV